MMFRTAMLLLLGIGAAVTPADTRAQFLEREQRLTGLHAKYRWFWGKAPRSADPFDRNTWIVDDPTNVDSSIEAWIVRPHFRVHERRGGESPKDLDTAWVDGKRTAKHHSADAWGVTIDQNRRYVTGPIPFLTPLELQTFDLQESLFELVRSGALAITAEDAAHVKLENGVTALRVPWKLRVTLNKTYDLAPEEVEARLDLDHGAILWRMRTTRFDPAGKTFVIGQAILAMNNENVDRTKWQTYLFDASTYQHESTLTVADLEVDLPTRNVMVVNEIDCYSEVVDGSGKVVDQRRWTPEERKIEIQQAADGWAQRQESIAALGRRRTLFGYSVSAAALLVIGLGVWAWKRR